MEEHEETLNELKDKNYYYWLLYTSAIAETNIEMHDASLQWYFF